MYKKLKLYKMARFMLLPFLLTACVQQEISEEPNIPSSLVESITNVEKPENNPNAQQDVSTGNSNQDILTASAGTTITQTIETYVGGVISIDAQVDVDGISRVSCYRYIPLQFTDESRKALFKKWFPAEEWDVNEAAVYNEKEDVWEFVTPLGEGWIYQVNVSENLDEQIMNLERVDEKADHTGESIISSVRIDSEFIEVEDMLLMEVTGCVPREIQHIGQETINTVAGIDAYSCSYIYICEEGGSHMYAKAVFKQMIDGMPVTVWHNFGTVTKNRGIFLVKE